MTLWHYLSIFSKHLSKDEVFKHSWNVAYWLKTLIILVFIFHKVAISTKINNFGAFSRFFLDCMDLLNFPSRYLTRFIKNFKMKPSLRKTLGDPTRKKEGE